MATYVPIASHAFTSNGSSYSFTGIPTDGTYTDLIIRGVGFGSSETGVTMTFNNDSASEYNQTFFNSWGSTITVEKWNVNIYRPGWNSTWRTTSPGTLEVNINSYATAGVKRVIYGINSVSNVGVDLSTCYYNTTSAINRVDVFGSFAAGTKFTIFGIKAGA